MAGRIKKTDRYVEQILEALREGYGRSHPQARIEAYRYNPASIRIRIIDPDFKGKDLVERERVVEPVVDTLPEEVRSHITILLLLTAKERKTSLGSLQFDNPTRFFL